MPLPDITFEVAGGDKLPAVGLGLWKVAPADAPALVSEAISGGYRHLDCASDYGNEPAVGAGLQAVLNAGACRRDELWVTSKLWNSNHAPEHVRPALERTLDDLRLDYLDLYLIHFPIATKHVPFEQRYPAGWFYDPDAPEPCMELAAVPIRDTWQAMEEAAAAGLVRNIGISNFGCSLIRDLLSYARTRPAVLQVELHPLLAQEKLLRFCREADIVVTGFSPLGAPSYVPLGMAQANESLLDHPTIKEISDVTAKTPAQVLLRWGVQRGTAVVPKTSNPARLKENLAIFDFELGADQVQAISSLDRNRRFNDPGVFCEAAFNTFCPIYE
jgi:D-xylose reductase